MTKQQIIEAIRALEIKDLDGQVVEVEASEEADSVTPPKEGLPSDAALFVQREELHEEDGILFA